MDHQEQRGKSCRGGQEDAKACRRQGELEEELFQFQEGDGCHSGHLSTEGFQVSICCNLCNPGETGRLRSLMFKHFTNISGNCWTFLFLTS